MTFYSKPVPSKGNVTVSVSVAGRHIDGYSLTGRIVEWSGYGVIVRIWQTPGLHPLKIRAASVRNDCARVNVLATW
jgi:hypothetical protein